MYKQLLQNSLKPTNTVTVAVWTTCRRWRGSARPELQRCRPRTPVWEANTSTGCRRLKGWSAVGGGHVTSCPGTWAEARSCNSTVRWACSPCSSCRIPEHLLMLSWQNYTWFSSGESWMRFYIVQLKNNI